MRKIALLAGLGLLALPALATAQTITATATISATRTALTGAGNQQNLDFGTIAAGAGSTVDPSADFATAGYQHIRFNVGTSVTVATPATLSSGSNTISVASYSCGVADDASGTNYAAFGGTCAAGTEWLNAAVTASMDRWVFVGGNIAAAATTTAMPGTYTGTITISLAASSS